MRKEIDTFRENTQVMLLLPTGRDAEIVQKILAQENISSVVFDSYQKLLKQLGTECGPVIIAQEALYKVNVNPLFAIMDSQPHWSELPIIVLQDRGREKQLINALVSRPSISVIPRPLRRSAFVMLVHAAMENRLRQFAVRDLLSAEKALQKSEAKYRLIAENMADIITTMDMDLNFTYVSPSIIKLRGYTAEEALAQKVDQILTPESFQRLSKVFAEEFSLEQTGTADPDRSRIIELEEYKKDGSTILVENTASFIRDSDQRPVGILSISRDITERKQAEIKLTNAKKQWEETFDAISDWVSIIDKHHTIIRSNNASNSIVDLSPNELAGRHCYENFHSSDCPIADCPGKRAFKSKQREEMELQFEDGRWFRVTVDPIDGKSDGPERFVHVVRDITDVKKQEQDLISAQKFKAFSLLSGGIAHDFNNLMSIIMGNLSLLRDDLTTSFHQELLEEIESACELSKNLTHQFLTLSEGWGMNKSPCDIKPILQSAIDDVLQTRQLTVSMDIKSPHTTLEGDRAKLQTAFHNIILNSAEAMPENGKLYIQVAPVSKFDGMPKKTSGIQIVFTDTGKGIDPGDLPNIFDPYFSSKQMGVQKGRGLGLSVAKAVITKHGGDITVESALGKGTTVCVCLPVSTFKTGVVSTQIQALPPGKPIVLLMEDEPSLQRLCKRILEGFGFGVLAANSAKEAFALFERAGQKDFAIELLIFDQAVSGDMSGAETLKELRIKGFDGKAIIVSGSPNNPEMADYQAYGFDDRLLKPYTKTDIKQVIGAVLNR